MPLFFLLFFICFLLIFSQMFSIPAGYAWVILCAVLVGVQCLAYGFYVSSARTKYFSKKFFADKFPELKAPPQGGYPDMGSGKFADKLSLSDWIDFNNYMRVHMNYTETVATVMMLVLASGLFNARFTVIAAIVYMVGRYLYGIGYISKGPGGRLLGAILFDLALLYLIGNSIYGMYSLGGGVDGFLSFIMHNKA